MYFELKISFNQDQYEQVCSYLYDNEITSFEEGETGFNENGDVILINEHSVLTFRSESEEELKNLLSDFINNFPNAAHHLSSHNNDYLNAWKLFSSEIEISKDIIIIPSWLDNKEFSHKIKINLDPGYAFGSGSHETTILCAKELENLGKKEDNLKLLDIGCGSGILSIIGSKLGYKSILGVDIDDGAIAASFENSKLNNIKDINFTTNTLNQIPDKYDIIVANILSSTLKNLKNDILNKLNPNGILILSGILKEEAIEMASYFYEFSFAIKIMHDWACLKGKINNST